MAENGKISERFRELLERMRGFRDPLGLPFLPRMPMVELVSIVGAVVLGVALLSVLLVRTNGSHPDSRAGADDHPAIASELYLGTFAHRISRGGYGENRRKLLQMLEFKASAVLHGKPIDALRLEDEIRSHRFRVRQVVEEVARGTAPEQFSDPELEQFRSNLRTAINEVLGRGAIREIVFSEFRSYEMPLTVD